MENLKRLKKATGFGVSFATDGGKSGAMVTPQAGRDTPQVDMTVVVGLTDVWGTDTNSPNIIIALDNSTSPANVGDDKSGSTMSNSNDGDKIQISIPKVTFDASANSKSANLHDKDTVVSKKDSARVTNDAKKTQQNDIKNFNKKHGTNF